MQQFRRYKIEMKTSPAISAEEIRIKIVAHSTLKIYQFW